MATLSRTRPSGAYLAVWLLLSSIAVVYMASLSLRPDVMARIAPPIRLAALSLDDDEAEMRRAAAEVETLRRTLYAARAEAGSLRVELARRSDREAALTQQIAALEVREARVAEAEAAASAAAAPAAASRQAAAQLAAKARQSTTRAPAQPPAPPAAAAPGMTAVERLANAAALEQLGKGGARAAPVETASLPPAGKAAEPAAPVGIVLSTGPSVDSLRLNWSVLSQRHQEDLARLSPRYTANSAPGASGNAFDLIAGPLPSTAEAQRVCAQLRAKFVSCKVGAFGGSAL